MSSSHEGNLMRPQHPVPEAEFDGFSEAYQPLLDHAIQLAGEEADYFAEMKAQYVAGLAGRDFTGKLLDFGCGIGLVSQSLSLLLPDCRLHGFDLSTASLRNIPPTLQVKGKFTAVMEELDSDYDLIFAANVIHHVALDLRQSVVKALAARLAPGGRLVIFEHNPLNPLTRWVVSHCAFDAGITLLWPSEVSNYLRQAGILLRKQDYIVFFPRWLAWLRRFESALSWCPLGAQYVMVGEAGVCN